MRRPLILFSLLIFSFTIYCGDSPYLKKALKIMREAIVFDLHEDVPTTMLSHDVSKDREKGQSDLPKLLRGLVSAPVFAVYTPHSLDKKNPASHAIKEFKEIYRFAEKNRRWVEIAYSSKDIERIVKKEKKIAILISMENCSPIEDEGYLYLYYRLGLRMAILTHMRSNRYADSSTDEEKWGGLSEEGKNMVRLMNRLGIVLDVSHLSDKAAMEVVRLSQAPVIASHSGVRAINNVARNLPDELIKAIAEKGGVIGVCFVPSFLDPEVEKSFREFREKARKLREKYGKDRQAYRKAISELRASFKFKRTTIKKVVEHIKYIADLVGVDHVAIGSDFEGTFMTPVGLENVSKMPNLAAALLEAGFSEKDVKKILGENFLRVLKEVEKVAKRLSH